VLKLSRNLITFSNPAISCADLMTDKPPNLDEDALARAVFASFAAMALGGARWVDIGQQSVGAMSLSSTFAMYNGVITSTLEPDVEAVATAARLFLGGGSPWSIQLRDQPTAPMLALASSFGLTSTETEALMVLCCPRIPTGPSGGDLQVERIGASDSDVYLAALAEGSEAPPSSLAALASPDLLSSHAVAAYLGYIDGVAVATAMTTLVDGRLGVSNIATIPAHRNHGYARAITAAAIENGAAAGASLAFLQCAPATVSLYTPLGFQVVEEWTYLLAP
jgi:ribosomal protein S18 acetylase RimI-like enzyme